MVCASYGNRIDYEAGNFEGGRTNIAFEKFIKRKSLPASIEIEDCAELERRTGLNELNLVYFGDPEGPAYEAFKRGGKSPKLSKKFMFYNTMNPECVISMLNIDIFNTAQTSFTALIRSFDESPVMYMGSPPTQEGLVRFAKKHELPMVIDVKEKMIDTLF